MPTATSPPQNQGSSRPSRSQFVKAGDVLAELDTQVLREQLRMNQARAASTARITSTSALLRVRQQRKESLQPLLASGHANQAEVEQSVAEYEAAVAGHTLAREESLLTEIQVAQIHAQIEQPVIPSISFHRSSTQTVVRLASMSY